MPTLEEATRTIDRSGLKRVEPQRTVVYVLPQPPYPADPNPMATSPLPPIQASPDSLRQFYLDGVVPQNRLLTPLPLGQVPVGAPPTNTLVINNSSSAPKSTLGTIQQTALTTPNLLPLQSYLTTINTSRTFLPIKLTSSAQARIQLYATAAAQLTDSSRPSTTSVGPGTMQGVFFDVTLDTSPFSWLLSFATLCANGDEPQKPLAYVTITNINPLASVPITVSMSYLILEA